MKTIVNVNQKIGQPNYGSFGASCSFELEIDQALLGTDPQQVLAHCRLLGDLARAAVERELDLQRRKAAPAAREPGDDDQGDDLQPGDPAYERQRPARAAITPTVTRARKSSGASPAKSGSAATTITSKRTAPAMTARYSIRTAGGSPKDAAEILGRTTAGKAVCRSRAVSFTNGTAARRATCRARSMAGGGTRTCLRRSGTGLTTLWPTACRQSGQIGAAGGETGMRVAGTATAALLTFPDPAGFSRIPPVSG